MTRNVSFDGFDGFEKLTAGKLTAGTLETGRHTGVDSRGSVLAEII
jgi:hypothetical protein